MRVFAIVLLLFALFLTGCFENNSVETSLHIAEKVMQQRPDSALHLIENIDSKVISRRSTRARYGLLYSQALDKNFIDVDNDSLIRYARDYYRFRKTSRNKFLSGYYFGIVQCNRGDYTRGLLNFLRIEDMGEELNDPYLLGLLYHQISEIYQTAYDYPNTLKYALLAYNSFNLAGKNKHSGYALFDVGDAYFNLDKQDSACIYYTKSLLQAQEQCDTTMQRACLSNLAMSYIEQEKPGKARDALWQIKNDMNQSLSFSEYITMAVAHQLSNDLDSARMYIRKAETLAEDDPTLINQIKSTAARIDYNSGNFKKSAEELMDCLAIQDSLVRIALQRSYSSLHRDYLEKRQRTSAKMLRIAKHRFWLATALFILILAFTGYVSYVKHRKRQLTVAKYLSAIDEINNANKLMLTKLETQQFKSSELRGVIKDRFALVGRLASTYYERQGANEQKAIYNEVRTLLDSYASDEKGKQEIEQVVNMCYDNVMQKVRQELPELKDWELDLLCYVYAGFSLRVISVFTGDSLNYIAVKKSRLKAKIGESNAPSKRLFLDLMS